jgi:hypothetical protein
MYERVLRMTKYSAAAILVLALTCAAPRRAAAADLPADRVLREALSFFSGQEVEQLPRIVLATVQTERTDRTTEGFTVPGYPVVYVAAWSETYKAAAGGDHTALIKLAAIIAHEATHVRLGPAERPAYEAEIGMLRRLEASPSMIDGVRRAMNAVAAGRR